MSKLQSRTERNRFVRTWYTQGVLTGFVFILYCVSDPLYNHIATIAFINIHHHTFQFTQRNISEFFFYAADDQNPTEKSFRMVSAWLPRQARALAQAAASAVVPEVLLVLVVDPQLGKFCPGMATILSGETTRSSMPKVIACTNTTPQNYAKCYKGAQEKTR